MHNTHKLSFGDTLYITGGHDQTLRGQSGVPYSIASGDVHGLLCHPFYYTE